MTHFYEIRIAGHLDAHWADWFDGMSITLEEDGTTLLSGPVPDQPALYGLLRKVRDLGLPLVSVNQITVTLSQQILNKKRVIQKMNTNTTQKLDTKVLLSTLLMKAIVFNQYGTPDVLKLADVAVPQPKDDQVLVKVYAVSVNSADVRLLSGPIPALWDLDYSSRTIRSWARILPGASRLWGKTSPASSRATRSSVIFPRALAVLLNMSAHVNLFW